MSENNFYDVKSKFKATKQEPKLSSIEVNPTKK